MPIKIARAFLKLQNAKIKILKKKLNASQFIDS